MTRIEELARKLNQEILALEVVQEYQKYEKLVLNDEKLKQLEKELKVLKKKIVNQKAKQDYLALDEVIDTEKQPEIEVKPEVEVEQEVEKTETSSSQSQKQPQKEVVTETTKQKDVVQTDDQSWLFEYGLLFMGSGILLLKGRKYFE